MLAPDLIDRILDRIGLDDHPEPDIDGLNALYAAVSGHLANDNIQKRIWFAGRRTEPVSGGHPAEFWENYLAHGTSGTCFPLNGAMCALLDALGFTTRRICSTMMIPGAERGISNHGSVLVSLDGLDYVVDAQISGFEALRLDPGGATRTESGIHSIRAAPIEDGFEVGFFPGHTLVQEFTFQTEPENDPVSHGRFVELYHRSAHEEGYSPFNAALYICRHFDDAIVTLHRGVKHVVTADRSLRSVEVDDEQLRKTLIEELGISEEAVSALPPDEPGPDMTMHE